MPVNRGGKAAVRVVIVSVGYVAAALLMVLPLAGILKRALALPDTFVTLVDWGLALGFPLAALIAWHYPKLGWHGHGRPDRKS